MRGVSCETARQDDERVTIERRDVGAEAGANGRLRAGGASDHRAVSAKQLGFDQTPSFLQLGGRRQGGGAADAHRLGVVACSNTIGGQTRITGNGVLRVEEVSLAVAVVIGAVADDFDRAWVHLLWLSATSASTVTAVTFGHEPTVAIAVGDSAVAESTCAVFTNVVGRAGVAASAAVGVGRLQVDATCGAPGGASRTLQVAAVAVRTDFAVGADLAATAAVLAVAHWVYALVAALDRAAAANHFAIAKLADLASRTSGAASAAVVGVVVSVYAQVAALFSAPTAARTTHASRAHLLWTTSRAATTAVFWVDVLVDALATAGFGARTAGETASALGANFTFVASETTTTAVGWVVLQVDTNVAALGDAVAAARAANALGAHFSLAARRAALAAVEWVVLQIHTFVGALCNAAATTERHTFAA